MYNIILEKAAEKFLRKLDNHNQKIIIKKLERLKTNPHAGIPLVGNFKGLWKYGIVDYRFTYKIDNNKLIVVGVNLRHRKNSYKQT